MFQNSNKSRRSGRAAAPTYDPTQHPGWASLPPSEQAKALADMARLVPFAQLEHWRRRAVVAEIRLACGTVNPTRKGVRHGGS